MMTSRCIARLCLSVVMLNICPQSSCPRRLLEDEKSEATVAYNEVEEFEKINNYYKNTEDKEEKKRYTWEVDTLLPLTVVDNEEEQLGDNINILPGCLALLACSDDYSGLTDISVSVFS